MRKVYWWLVDLEVAGKVMPIYLLPASTMATESALS